MLLTEKSGARGKGQMTAITEKGTSPPLEKANEVCRAVDRRETSRLFGAPCGAVTWTIRDEEREAMASDLRLLAARVRRQPAGRKKSGSAVWKEIYLKRQGDEGE